MVDSKLYTYRINYNSNVASAHEKTQDITSDAYGAGFSDSNNRIFLFSNSGSNSISFKSPSFTTFTTDITNNEIITYSSSPSSNNDGTSNPFEVLELSKPIINLDTTNTYKPYTDSPSSWYISYNGTGNISIVNGTSTKIIHPLNLPMRSTQTLYVQLVNFKSGDLIIYSPISGITRSSTSTTFYLTPTNNTDYTGMNNALQNLRFSITSNNREPRIINFNITDIENNTSLNVKTVVAWTIP